MAVADGGWRLLPVADGGSVLESWIVFITGRICFGCVYKGLFVHPKVPARNGVTSSPCHPFSTSNWYPTATKLHKVARQAPTEPAIRLQKIQEASKATRHSSGGASKPWSAIESALAKKVPEAGLEAGTMKGSRNNNLEDGR